MLLVEVDPLCGELLPRFQSVVELRFQAVHRALSVIYRYLLAQAGRGAHRHLSGAVDRRFKNIAFADGLSSLGCFLGGDNARCFKEVDLCGFQGILQGSRESAPGPEGVGGLVNFIRGIAPVFGPDFRGFGALLVAGVDGCPDEGACHGPDGGADWSEGRSDGRSKTLDDFSGRDRLPGDRLFAEV